MSDDQAMCAHCKVILKHNDYPDGTRSDYWECAYECGQRFAPVKAVLPVRPFGGILFCGWSGCGKDACGAFMHQHLGIPYASSTSWAALPRVANVLGVPDQIAWEQRHQNRERWKTICDFFRREDPLFLVRLALARGGQIVTGVRDKVEMDAAKRENLFSHYVWIIRRDNPKDETVTFDHTDCDTIIINDGTLQDFHRRLAHWARENFHVQLSNYAASLLYDLP